MKRIPKINTHKHLFNKGYSESHSTGGHTIWIEGCERPSYYRQQETSSFNAWKQ